MKSFAIALIALRVLAIVTDRVHARADHVNRVADGRWQPPLTTTKTTSSRSSRRPIADLASQFEPVLTRRGDIQTVPLLKACRELESAMRDMGKSVNARDMSQNIKKVERLYRKAPKGQRENIWSLLQYEKSLGIHGPSARLKDPSAAVGLLWIRRSISFTGLTYSKVLHGNVEPGEATWKAYEQELKPYHGFALRRIYTFGCVAIRGQSRREFLATIAAKDIRDFDEKEENSTVRDLQRLLGIWRPLVREWEGCYKTLDLEDRRRV